MGNDRGGRHATALALAVGCVALWPGAGSASPPPAALLCRDAEQLERQGQWEKACQRYEQIPVAERDGLVRGRYQACLRHFLLEQRHLDPAYRRGAQELDLSAALRTYDEVLAKLQSGYIERGQVGAARLFHEGVEELGVALQDELFGRVYLAGVPARAVRGFREHLAERWGRSEPRTRKDAERQVRAVAGATRQALGLAPGVVVLEFACGACNGLDEYTRYLTARELQQLEAGFRGEAVGVGIEEVREEDGKLFVARVYPPGSPADREHIQPGDRVLRVDGRPLEGLSAAEARERLRGHPGEPVVVTIMAAGAARPRSVTLHPETFAVVSVQDFRLLDADVGYVQLASFQDTTVEELGKAIRELRVRGAKALVLDLRGNPGGVVGTSVQVAERFLAEGIILTQQGPAEEQTRTFEAHNAGALAMPLVLLVDGDTASVAEALAGALKENHRALLVGQPTFGKGTVQGLSRLEAAPAGIRLTLARMISPLGRAYDGAGVIPHVLVERVPESLSDAQLAAALQQAHQLLLLRD